MNAKKLLLVILMLLTILCYQSYAETSQFGYVNIANVMLLHPTMKHFDPISKRFKIEALKDVDKNQRLEENKLNYQKNLNKLEDELKALEAKRVEIEEVYLERSEHMISNALQGNMSEKDRKDYEEKRAKLDLEYSKEADNLRLKILYAKKRIESFESNALYTGYASQGETNKLFSLMLDDVYEAIKAVNKRKNLSFVFNSSSEIGFEDGNVAAQNCLEEFFDNFKETLANPDGKVVTAAAFKSWLDEKNTVFWTCSDKRMSTFVLVGGVDLTVDVIDYIYEKYKIGKEQREFVKEYFEKIVKNQDN